MSTWNTVTIDKIIDPALLPYVSAYRESTVDPERVDFDLDECEQWITTGGGVPFVRLPDGKFGFDEANRTPDNAMWCSGQSKYRREEIGQWAAEWTKQNLGVRVTWTQEWDDGDGGAEVLVYLDGDLVRDECRKNALVPMDLEADVAAIRMLDASTPAYRAAVTKLLDALVPPRERDCDACQGVGSHIARGAEFDVASTTVECDACGGTGKVDIR